MEFISVELFVHSHCIEDVNIFIYIFRLLVSVRAAEPLAMHICLCSFSSKQETSFAVMGASECVRQDSLKYGLQSNVRILLRQILKKKDM